MSSNKQDSQGSWMGRRPKGQQDTNSFKSFLQKTPRGALIPHLQRHHKGLAKGK